MPRLDTNKIEGYENMTPEEKVAALEAMEYEDNSTELKKLKDSVTKANKEAAELKRKHKELLDEDTLKKQEEAERVANLESELAELKKAKALADNKAGLVALGYDEALADDTANAMYEGDMTKVFANQRKFLDGHDKQYKAELLGKTPTPPGGSEGDAMTLEKFRQLSTMERAKFAQEHAEEYNNLYSGGKE